MASFRSAHPPVGSRCCEGLRRPSFLPLSIRHLQRPRFREESGTLLPRKRFRRPRIHRKEFDRPTRTSGAMTAPSSVLRPFPRRQSQPFCGLCVAPGPGYVWVDGYLPGSWNFPPRPRAVWIGSIYRPEHEHSLYSGSLALRFGFAALASGVQSLRCMSRVANYCKARKCSYSLVDAIKFVT